ncbi:ABC transporter ATP-binding protein, partial [Glycomyces tenuis]
MFRRLEDLADPFQAADDRAPTAGVWAFLARNLRPLRRIAAMSLALSVVSAVLEVWLIYYAGRLVDLLAATDRDRFWPEHGTELALVAVLLLLVRPLAWLGREALDDIAFRPNALTLVRWRAHRHVLGHTVGWFQNDLSGRTAMRVRELGTAATGAAYVVIHTLSYVGVYIVCSFVLVSSVDPSLMLPLLAWVGLYAALMAYAVPRFRDTAERHQRADSALTGLIVDTYANIDVVKIYGGGDRAEDRERFAAARAAHIGMQRFEVTINVGMTALGAVLMAGLVGYALVLWSEGEAPIGLVAAAVALTFQISGQAAWLLDAVADLFGSLGAARESLRTVGVPHEVDDTGAAELAVDGGSIRLRGVSHHYGKGSGGLDDVSLEIAAGERIGLVGRSGAGKSTLVNLILRFFEAERGTIEIDGQDLSEVTLESLHRHLAVVGQDAVLLHRSVRDNLTLGRTDLTRDDIDAAVRKAAADAFVPGLRDQDGRCGYDALVGERGVKLSGGQRQRIALAR